MHILDIEEERVTRYNEIMNDINNIRNANITLEALESGLDDSSIEIMTNYTGVELSHESSLSDEYKSNLTTANKDIISYIERKFKKFHSISSKSKDYKIDQLVKYRDELKNNEREINLNINKDIIEQFNNKLGVFTASGYSLRKGCNDLTVFIKGINDLLKRNSKYINGIMLMADSLKDYKTVTDVLRTNGVTNVKKKFTNIVKVKNTRVQFTDYRFSIPDKWIAKNVTFSTVKYHAKTGIKVGMEKYSVTSTISIGEPSIKDLIALLDLAIEQKKNLDSVYNITNFTINRLIKLYTIELIKGESNSRFLLTRYCENMIQTLLNNYNDMGSVDDIVRLYVSKTTKKI